MDQRYFKKDLVIIDSKSKDKNSVIRHLAKILEKKGYGKNAEKIFDEAIKREKEFSTGIGDQIAIPHIRNNVMKAPVIVFSRVNNIPWDAVDHQKVKYVFFICMNEKDGQSDHLNVIASLSRLFLNHKFLNGLKNIKDYDDLILLIEKCDEIKEKEILSGDQTYDLVAVTACPTGVAHTFLAAEKLEKIAKEMNLKIKVETQGTEGARNVLTANEIKNAKGVILALDRAIDQSRFIGKNNVLDISTRAVIKDAQKEINKILNHEGKTIKGLTKINGQTEFSTNANLISFDNWWKRTYQAIMNGVSHMLPFVIFGGIMIAIAFMIDSFGVKITEDNSGNLGSILLPSRWFKGVGDLAFGLFVPILAAYMAFAMVGKGGLLPGFICGLISTGKFTNNGIPWLMPSAADLGVDPAQLASGSGFFGAIGGALISASLFILITKYILDYLPKSLNAIKNILIMPLFGTLIIVVVFFFLNIPLQFINLGFGMFLNIFEKTPELYPLLGLIMGLMMCSDLGGPINKAAYVFGTITLASSGINGSIPMAIAMGSGMVPPLAIALSCTFNKNLWTNDQRKQGYTNYVMGLSFISEGAIPFTAEQPRKMIIANLIGGAVSGIAIGALQVGLLAPHGGIFAAPLLRCQLFDDAGMSLGLGITLFFTAVLLGAFVQMLAIWTITRFTKFGKNKELENLNI
ncbi:MAG: PTS fructose transporter subunit IIABC [Mycoplasmoidaceae bacterium]